MHPLILIGHPIVTCLNLNNFLIKSGAIYDIPAYFLINPYKIYFVVIISILVLSTNF